MNIPQHIFDILQKRLDQQPVTEQEQAQLSEWYRQGELNNNLFGENDFEQAVLAYVASVSDEAANARALQRFMASANFKDQSIATYSAIAETTENIDEQANPSDSTQVTHRVHLLRKWRWAAAAILIVAIGITTAVFVSSKRQPTSSVAGNSTGPVSDILPGTNRAQLILSDGTTISLDSAATGAIAQEGNSSIVKMSNGQIVYNPKGTSQGVGLMNTMRTPRGGQYELILPDGTKVWLNASSSITYPAVFAGNDRKVKVTGEVYLEVTKDRARPFLVDVDGKSLVRVLGTSFNINAYAGEEHIETTLVEGSVKILPVNTAAGAAQSIILHPGQQAVIPHADPRNTKVQSANLERILAWKNGIFDFQDADFRDVLKQLERWYDIDIKVEGKLPEFKTQGQVDRGVKLSGIVRFLNNFGVNTRLEGRTLIVSEK